MLAGDDNQLAAAHLALGEIAQAELEYRRALKFSEEVTAHHAANLEAVYSALASDAGLGDVAAKTAAQLPRPQARVRWQEACDAYSKSLGVLDSIKEPAVLSPGFFPVRERHELASRLSECQRALKRTSPLGLPETRVGR
jgi:tetratricopeptide (TPR) repeat protein